jgi:replicative DNA helicase
MGEMKVGSAVCAIDGTVANVIGVYPLGERQIYRMTFHDGSSCEVTDDHIWLAWRMGRSAKKNGLRVGSDESAALHLTSEILATHKKGVRWLFPVTEPVAFTSNCRYPVRPMDPYLLGVILGDGSITKENIRISCAEPEIIWRIEANTGYKLKAYHTEGKKCSEYRLEEPSKERDYLKKVGLWGKGSFEKFIPPAYLLGTRMERISLLQGLMDTDGWSDKDGDTYYCTVSHRLRDDVVTLARSLGAIVTVRTKQAKDQHGNGSEAYTLRIKHWTPIMLFGLKRKQDI